MGNWTIEQVVALAPDPTSASAGQGLANPRKWSGLGRSDRAVWGLCQGSGKDPYQARVDLSGPAFKCSCPSRKFPCKHGLGLMLLLAKDEKTFKHEAEPGWVADWLASRVEKAEKKEERVKAAAERPVDPVAQAKRQAQRELRVQDGVAECRVWLEDLARRGLAGARGEPEAFWMRAAARMVDAQCPGLGGMIRRIPELLTSGDGWEVRTLDWMGRVGLLLNAADRLASLPPGLQADVKAALGFAQSKDDALSQAPVADEWLVVGQAFEDDDRLRVRRSWLVGAKTARRAMILEFTIAAAPASSPMDASLVVGARFAGELVFYPSAWPLRALIKGKEDARSARLEVGTAGDDALESGLERFAEALGSNPWTGRYPLIVRGARMVKIGEAWGVRDANGAVAPLSPRFAASIHLWRMIMVGGGGEMTISGEWDGEWLSPMAAMGAGGVVEDLAQRWVA